MTHSAVGPSLVERHMPVLARTGGSWAGTYTEVDMANTVTDEYNFELDISFPDDGDVAYRQATRYRWADGRSQDFVFDAALTMEGDQAYIAWDHDVMFGKLFEIDDRTLQLRFSYKGEDLIEVQEAMFVSPDGQYRMRTWHWYKDGVPFRKTIVKERRI